MLAFTIIDHGGNDTLDGGANVDTAIVRGLRSAYSVTQTATGVFRVVGAHGTDTLTAVEFLQFDDQVLRLRPGTGVSFNFNTANPAVYQTATNAIREFDGNALGGDGAWLRIGQADGNGDGDIAQILVNRAIGRFANYQSQQEVIDYLTANGFGPETWAGWFSAPSEGEAGLMQASLVEERVDLAEASGRERSGLALLPGLDTAMPESISSATFASLAPAPEDHMRPEFYG
ncbi:MAG: hypothetical protein OHK0018_00940 [Erythrobacter tepidarius]